MNRRLTFALSSFLCILTASCHRNPPSPPPETKFISSIQLMDTLVLDIAKSPGIELAYVGATTPESGGGNPDHSSYRKTLFTEGYLSSRDRIESLMNYLAHKIDTQLRGSDVEGSYMGETIQKEHGTNTFRREYSKTTEELRTRGYIDVLVTHRGRGDKGELVSLVILISESTVRL
jgi:hypothetical protein